MRIEVIHPKELDEGLRARWRAFQAAGEGLGSPYLTPDWAGLIGAARGDARIAVLMEGGLAQGFLGVQRPSRFAAMGLGAPISDYQALAGAPEAAARVSARDLCAALKVGRIDLTHVPPGQPFFAAHRRGEAGSWLVDVSEGFGAYQAAQKARRPDFVKQLDKKRRKFARDKGDLRFTARAASRADFAQLLGWKRVQLWRSGQPPIWDAPWVSRVLDQAFAAEGEDFAGVLFTLHAGDHLAAANFMLRARGVLHDWIIGYNPAFDSYSPGVLLARFAIEWAAGEGLREVDFGPGDYQYKRQLASGQRALAWGSAAGVSASGLVREAAYAARGRIERLPQKRLAALPGKAMRKLDLLRALAAPAG